MILEHTTLAPPKIKKAFQRALAFEFPLNIQEAETLTFRPTEHTKQKEGRKMAPASFQVTSVVFILDSIIDFVKNSM